MYYIDLPSPEEIGALNLTRSDACVSIYLPTTPKTQQAEISRIALGNLLKQAVTQLEQADFDKRRIISLREQFDDLLEDDDFWAFQANSLAILATPESIRTYRLANKLSEIVEVSDRFHLKPLLRAVTFPHSAYVLALSESASRLVEVSADLPAQEVQVPGMPANAAEAAGVTSNRNFGGTGHRQGSQGQNFHLTRYVRKVDAALRPLLQGSDMPLILAMPRPLENLFRSLSSIEAVEEAISGNPERMTEAELASAARPVLDSHYAGQIQDFHRLFEQRTGQQRTTTDISTAARLATFGGIDRMLVDMDGVVDGFVDDETGEVTLGTGGDAKNYGIVDEIASRALRTGAKVMAVHKADIPGAGDLAVIARYPL